jgi:hypothetical protein
LNHSLTHIFFALSEIFKDYHRWTGEGVGREYLERRGEDHR